MYRGFYKNLNNLAGNSITSADLRVQEMTIKRDILTLTTSDITVVNIPTAFTEGNLFGVYDDYGQTVYIGIIKSLEDNVIQCEDILSLFNDEWRFKNPSATTVEGKIKSIITDNLGKSSDSYQADIFSSFSVSTISSTTNELETQDGTVNLMEYLEDIYSNFGILLDISVQFNAITPTIKIGKPSYTTLQLGNNTQVLRNFAITKETQETNKLEIYSSDGTTLRATYYATQSGITTDSTSLDRLARIKTKIVFSDDELTDIVANNLTEDMFNHKITVELVLQNKLYNFDDFHLGQSFSINYNGNVYDSVLTGYSITINDQGKADTVKLTFGKVRQTLESKIQAISAQVYSQKVQQEGSQISGTVGSKTVPIFLNDGTFEKCTSLSLNTTGTSGYSTATWVQAWSGKCVGSGSTITATIPTSAKAVVLRWYINSYYSTLYLPKTMLNSTATKYIVSDETYYAGGTVKISGTTLTYAHTGQSNTSCYLDKVYYKN